MNSTIDVPPGSSNPMTGDEKLWAIFSHLSCLLGVGIILPLIVYLVKRNESKVVADHAREALNFHISLLIYSLVSLLLVIVGIGVLLLMALGVATLVLAIIGAVKAYQGTFFRYPLILRLIP